jgi:hypothetical protein
LITKTNAKQPACRQKPKQKVAVVAVAVAAVLALLALVHLVLVSQNAVYPVAQAAGLLAVALAPAVEEGSITSV